MPRPSATEDVFRAIADPTRRAVLDLLIARGEESVSALAAPFRMSLPAVSRHLRVLKEAGLVTERRSGKQRLYRLTPEPLKGVHDWAKHYERFWIGKLDALGQYLRRTHEEER